MTRRMRVADDHGVAMITTIMVVALLASLGTIVTILGVNNTQNADRDRQSGAALALSDAGVAEAVLYIRTKGVGGLTCPEDAAARTTALCPGTGATATDWANPTSRHTVVTASERTFKTWIGVVTKVTATTFGTYRVHSQGLSGGAPAVRNVDVDIRVSRFPFPLGVYGDTMQAGPFAIQYESVFTSDCIAQRDKLNFATTTDKAYGIPAAAHSVSTISVANSCPGPSIHQGGSQSVATNQNCSNAYPNDQDGSGGPLAGTTCVGAAGAYPQTSFFDQAALESFGYKPRGLSAAEYDALREVAQSQGQFRTSNSLAAADFPDPAVYPQAVMYFDLRNGGGKVSISGTDIPAGYIRAPSDTPPCGTNSLVIVVEGGDLDLNNAGDQTTALVGAIFVPDGTFKNAGGSNLIGTVFAHNVSSFTGNASIRLDDCFLNNLPGPLDQVRITRFREVDTG
ncbi:MAG: hypothetical protein LC640_00745 [Frankia sp.]|nr:hypothetical protein [Frankia sp.]